MVEAGVGTDQQCSGRGERVPPRSQWALTNLCHCHHGTPANIVGFTTLPLRSLIVCCEQVLISAQ